MTPALREAAEGLVRRAGLAGVRGGAVDAARLPGAVPAWYAELLAVLPLAGLRIGVPAPEGGGPRWLQVSDEWALWREASPAPGFLAFGRCAEGGGNRYAFAAADTDADPPVLCFAPGGADGQPVCARLFDLLRWAPVLVWDEGRGE